MKRFRKSVALSILLSLKSLAPLCLAAQGSHRVEGSIGAVWGLPLSNPSAAPGWLLRVGVAQVDPKSRLSARLAVEGVFHHRGLLDESESYSVRTIVGLGYDLRLRSVHRRSNDYFLMGAGVYRTVGNKGDSYPLWLLTPRIGWGGEIELDRVNVGLEASAQYPALTNFGPTNGQMGLMFPVGITIRY